MKIIPPKSVREINTLLSQRNLEDRAEIKRLEQQFKKRRSQVISLPKAGSSVILLVSGGLDSIIVWFYLIKVYKLKVYPVFFWRGQRREKLEYQAVAFYHRYIQKHFPRYSAPLQSLQIPIPAHEIRFPITIASNRKINHSQNQQQGIPVYSNLLVSNAVQYAVFREITEHIHIRHIFTGFMFSDGNVMKDETLTAMRTINYAVCMLTGDWQWQVSALPLEKELGFFHDKYDFVSWAAANQIPLTKTRSCIKWSKYHCGDCLSCRLRMYAFEKAGVPDETLYESQRLTLSKRLQLKLQKLF